MLKVQSKFFFLIFSLSFVAVGGNEKEDEKKKNGGMIKRYNIIYNLHTRLRCARDK